MNEDREVLVWLDEYFGQFGDSRGLIGVLLALQERFGYLSLAALREVAGKMGVTPANVYGVATFYNHFRFSPPGKYPIKVCTGTACHIKQATTVLEHWERRLKIGIGEVTEDKKYSLDRVACVGCCTLAPVTVIGEKVIGQMSVTKVDGILLQHQIQEKSASGEPPGSDPKDNR